MKPINLREALLSVNPEYPALSTPECTTFFGEMQQSVWVGGDSRAVLIFCNSIHNTVRAMIALDGEIDAFCALSTRLNRNDLEEILGQWSFDLVIIDEEMVHTDLFHAHEIRCANIDQVIVSSVVKGAIKSTKWLVPTSGTTSAPKLVIHSFETLAHSALAGNSSVKEKQAWAMLYDVTRFAGYQVLLHTMVMGYKLVCMNLDTPIEQRIDFWARNSVTHFSATPSLWRKILMCPESDKLKPLQITLGGEAADQKILSLLAEKYPRTRITHIFASTEAGVGLAVSDGKAGFPLNYLDKSHHGVEISCKSGRLHVRTNAQPSGYAQSIQLIDKDGWIDTGDIMELKDDRFFIIGRENGIINVGGDKVVPEAVRAALLSCDFIEEALVYGKTSPFTGKIVAADVVLKPAIATIDARKLIDEHLALQLNKTQHPRYLRFVSEIKINDTGKVSAKRCN